MWPKGQSRWRPGRAAERAVQTRTSSSDPRGIGVAGGGGSASSRRGASGEAAGDVVEEVAARAWAGPCIRETSAVKAAREFMLIMRTMMGHKSKRRVKREPEDDGAERGFRPMGRIALQCPISASIFQS
jgi:hypothetical protein